MENIINWEREEKIDFEDDEFYIKTEAIGDYIIAKHKINNKQDRNDNEYHLLHTAESIEEMNDRLFYLYKLNKINQDEYYFLSATMEVILNPRTRNFQEWD